MRKINLTLDEDSVSRARRQDPGEADMSDDQVLARPETYTHYEAADSALQAAVLAHGIAEGQPGATPEDVAGCLGSVLRSIE